MIQSIEIQIDREVDAAYVRLSANDVAATHDVTEEVLIDLDDMGIAVGIEVLRLDAELPYDTLCVKYHVHSDVVDVLRQIRPSVEGFMSFTAQPDGVSRAAGTRKLAPA